MIARDAANLLHMVARLEVASTRRVLATNIEIARTFGDRLRGLIGRMPLEEGEAMLFERAKQVHTFGMRVPLDVVFCDREWNVVHVVKEMAPRRVSRFVRSAYFVIELPPGTSAGLDKGDRLLAG